MKKFAIRASISGLALMPTLLRAVPVDGGVILSPPAWTNNQATFTLSCEAGVSYVIETSPDLQSWTPVQTNTDAGISRSITIDAANDGRFYRARRAALASFCRRDRGSRKHRSQRK